MTGISIQETTNQKNLLLLVALRWLAVGGQVATIAVVHLWYGIPLPLRWMGGVLVFLVALNFLSLYRCRRQMVITHTELLLELLLDVTALGVQLYLSGGATNPFISLFLFQVALGAVLLQPWATWLLVGVTGACYIGLTSTYQELGLPTHMHRQHLPGLFDLHVQGMFICFLLAAVLLVLFVSRITHNLQERDDRLSRMRQQSAEEEHIVRMGLLASGAAHELGTPLSTLSVILNDWGRMAALKSDPDFMEELGEMRTALGRCKDIVSSILLAAGEARGQDAEATTLIDFLDDVVAEWRDTRRLAELDYVNRLTRDVAIAADTVIRQTLFNVLDNALEASPAWVGMEVLRQDDQLVVRVRDRGPGFPPAILARFGKPYQSTKGRPGHGLGLFLVVNVLRKLGGTVVPANNPQGGATLELRLPIAALAIEDEDEHR